jgi:hypothetical protein
MTGPAQGIHDHPQLKLGKRPPKRARALRLAQFVDIAAAAAAPTYPIVDDNFQTFVAAGRTFGLYRNDAFGVCGPTMIANSRRLATFGAGAYEEPSQEDVFDLYRRSGNPDFDPATGTDDNGVDNQTMLEEAHRNGIGGVKCLAFASVDHTDLDEMRAAINRFDFLCTGVNLDIAQQGQSNGASPVWSYVKGSPSWGGHDVLTAKYTSDPARDAECVSWAQFIDMTDEFVLQQLDEAWVVIWPETYAKMTDVERRALAAAYEALTGRPFPVQPPAPAPVPPEPTPAPTPTPGPSFVDVDQQLADAARSWLSRRWHAPHERRALRVAMQDWLDMHYGANGGRF